MINFPLNRAELHWLHPLHRFYYSPTKNAVGAQKYLHALHAQYPSEEEVDERIFCGRNAKPVQWVQWVQVPHRQLT
jgi:hypothetical protein